MDYIPIIDLKNIGEIPSEIKGNDDWSTIAQQFRECLGSVGFVYLKNHGINKSLIDNAFSASKTFFGFPEEVKLKYKKNSFVGNFHSYYGYTGPSEEILHPTSKQELRETYDFLEEIGVYPDKELPEFNLSIIELRKCGHKLAKKILILLAISLKLDDPQFFVKHCSHIDNLSLPRGDNMRALHYPSITEDLDLSTDTVRLGEHTDYGLLTFLFQDMIGGLEVQRTDGKWIVASPIADTILLNTGDLLEFWSSGIFRATNHRVMVPTNMVQKQRSRYSIACFLGPNVDTIVTTLKVDKTEMEKERLSTRKPHINYDETKPVVAMDYIMERLLNTYAY